MMTVLRQSWYLVSLSCSQEATKDPPPPLTVFRLNTPGVLIMHSHHSHGGGGGGGLPLDLGMVTSTPKVDLPRNTQAKINGIAVDL